MSCYLTLSGLSLRQSQPVSYCGSTFPYAAVIPQYPHHGNCGSCVYVCLSVKDHWTDVPKLCMNPCFWSVCNIFFFQFR